MTPGHNLVLMAFDSINNAVIIHLRCISWDIYGEYQVSLDQCWVYNEFAVGL